MFPHALWISLLEIEKQLLVMSGLFENCNSFFSTQGAGFGSKCFDCADRVALPDNVAGDSFTLIDWGRPNTTEDRRHIVVREQRNCIMMFVVRVLCTFC